MVHDRQKHNIAVLSSVLWMWNMGQGGVLAWCFGCGIWVREAWCFGCGKQIREVSWLAREVPWLGVFLGDKVWGRGGGGSQFRVMNRN